VPIEKPQEGKTNGIASGENLVRKMFTGMWVEGIIFSWWE
jgi:hypothetical protein